MKISLAKLLPILVFLLFGYYLVGNNFNAKLGIIDDHEIATFLGQDGIVEPSEFVPTLMSTEVGQWGSATRYRPSYYSMRILETAMWRDNAGLWYGARFVSLIISMIVAWKILSLYFPSIIAYLFVFYTLTMPFWPDLLTRLGPSEIYALPALLFFVYGLIKNNLAMITISFLVAVGGKENLLILLPVLMVRVGVLAVRKKLTKAEIGATLISLGYTLFIITGVVMATNRAGVDFYLNNISYSDRIVATFHKIPEIVENRHMLAPLTAFALMIIYAIWKKKIGKINQHIWLGITLILVAMSQYVFYNNILPTNGRYDFPALLLFPIFDLVVAKMLIQLSTKLKTAKLIKLAIYFGLCLFMLAFIVKRGYVLTQNSARNNAISTTTFDTNLRQVSEVALKHPDATLVFVSDKYFSFEPMISVARFLTAKKITNKFVIDYTHEPMVADPLGIELETRITDSMMGNATDDKSFERFSPKSEVNNSCYSVTFGSALALPLCPQIASF